MKITLTTKTFIKKLMKHYNIENNQKNIEIIAKYINDYDDSFMDSFSEVDLKDYKYFFTDYKSIRDVAISYFAMFLKSNEIKINSSMHKELMKIIDEILWNHIVIEVVELNFIIYIR